MKRAYLAGSLDADAAGYLKNVHIMHQWAERLRLEGYAVFIPCNDLIQGIIWGYWEYEDYFQCNASWIEVADVLFVIPKSEKSKGTQREIEIAKKYNVEVKYL